MELKKFVKAELTFLGKLVLEDLKSYQLWFHRLWLLKTLAEFEVGLVKKAPKLFAKMAQLKQMQRNEEIKKQEQPAQKNEDKLEEAQTPNQPKHQAEKKNASQPKEEPTQAQTIKTPTQTPTPKAAPPQMAFEKAISQDLMLCEKFLAKDERNFHTWNYRFNVWKVLFQFSSKSHLDLIQSEIQFIDKIHRKNYSNYSAIHFKINFFEKLISETKKPLDTDLLLKELQMVEEGLIISPNEQALYLYQKWLFTHLIPLQLVSVSKISKNSRHLIFNDHRLPIYE